MSHSKRPSLMNTGSTWNTNSWHWEEKNLNNLTESRLKELFSLLEIPVDGGKIIVSELSKYEGDAYSNIRKGKKRIGYDFSISLNWVAEMDDGTSFKGTLDVKEITSEEDEYEFCYKVEGDDDSSRRFRDVLKSKAKPAVYKTLSKWESEIKAE